MDQSAIVRAEKEQQKLARLIDLLLDWADWMKLEKYVDGYPDHSPVVSGAGLKSFEDMCDAVDETTNEAVYACINDLSPKHSTAIHAHYLPSRFGAKPEFYNRAATLQEAHDQLILKVQKKGIDLG